MKEIAVSLFFLHKMQCTLSLLNDLNVLIPPPCCQCTAHDIEREILIQRIHMITTPRNSQARNVRSRIGCATNTPTTPPQPTPAGSSGLGYRGRSVPRSIYSGVTHRWPHRGVGRAPIDAHRRLHWKNINLFWFQFYNLFEFIFMKFKSELNKLFSFVCAMAF